VRLVLFKLCERDLFSGIGKLYESLDARLAQSGVLPELAARRPAASRPDRARLSTSRCTAMRRKTAAFRTKTATMPLPLGQPVPQSLGRHRGEMRQWAEAAGGGFAATGPGPSRGPAASAAGGMGGAGLPDGAQGVLLDALHELLQQTRHERESRQRRPTVAAANAGGRSLSQREMLSVLSLLQATPTANLRAAMGEQSESLAQRLKSEVLSGATARRRSGAGPPRPGGRGRDRPGRHVVRRAAGRARPDHAVEELIGKLVVPFDRGRAAGSQDVRAEDPSGATPAQRAGRGLRGQSGRKLGRAQPDGQGRGSGRAGGRVQREHRHFHDAGGGVPRFPCPASRRVEITERRAAEIQRGQERLDLARERAKRELEDRIDGREDLPGAVLEFLRTPWQHHATMAVLREGVDGSAFVEALALADGLLDEVDEARGHPEGERAWLAAWDAPLRKVLQSMGVRDAAADTAISALRETLAAIARSRPEQAVPLPALPPVAMPQPVAEERPRVQLVGGTDTLDFDNADADHFRALPVGTWLDFVERDGKVQAGKLSWVSPISKRLLFVNRRGVRFCVASPEELAVMVRLGRLRAHANDTAFDSAMQSVIDRLAPDQARAPDAEEEAMP
jgi:hypothetical protein